MNRILDFSPSQEEAVVSRVLVLVHQAIDDAFPSAEKAGRQFTKTVFSEDGEKTAAHRPGDHFGSNEDTSPDGRPMHADKDPLVPPPPPARVPPAPKTESKSAAAKAEKAAAPESAKSHGFNSALNPMAGTRGQSRSTRLDTHMEGMGSTEGPDWVTRITLALLIAGLMLLAYVLFA